MYLVCMDICCIVLVNYENVISISEILDYVMFHENMKCLSIFKVLWMNFGKE